jgi:phosphoserine phosphatase RsbU/P
MLEQLIRQLPLFAALPRDEVERLALTLRERDFPAGTVLMTEGAQEDFCFILIEGEVEIVKSMGTPDERVLGARGPVSFVGEMSFFSNDGRRTASVRSLAPLRMLEVTRADFDALLQRQPRLAYELVHTFSARLSASENQTIRDLQEKNRQLSEAYEALKAAHAQIVEKEKMERELAVARDIQRSILPRVLPQVPGVDLGAQMIPTRSVAGDLYDVIPLGNGRLGVAVGDVSDKGVPAALFMALTYSIMRAEAYRSLSPCDVLQSVNRQLNQLNNSGMFVTVLYGVLDCPTGEFHYARAGHDSPLLLDAWGDEVYLPSGPGQPLGLFDVMALDEQRARIPPGGTLFIYTDGVTEARNPAREFFDLHGLREVVRAHRNATASQLCQNVWDALVAFTGTASQFDDVTLLAVKMAQGPS